MIARSISTTATFLALAFAVQFDAGAALRASAAAETVIRDSSKRLSAGDLHTCRALVDGTVRCCGENLHG